MTQQIQIGHHWTETIGPLTVHMDTLTTAWLAMLIVIFCSLLITKNLNRIPGKLQTFGEVVFGAIENLVIGQIGKDGKSHIPLIGSLFLFILTANLIGQLPWRLYHLPEGEFAAPTNDLNVTAAMGIIVLLYYIGAGIAKKGLGYFKHYFQPFWFMAPFNLLEDIAKPVTLSLRLFANIVAGEIIVLSFIGLLPLFLPIPMMLFEIFVAFIQAFIFAILSATYIGMAVSEEH